MKKQEPKSLRIDQEGKKEVIAEVIQTQVHHGPKTEEGPFDVPGLNMTNPIASYAPYDPAGKEPGDEETVDSRKSEPSIE